MEETKICTRCGKTKPLSDFGLRKGGRSGLRCYCKDCRSKYAANYYLVHRDKLLARSLRYYIEHREKKRSQKLFHLYGITLTEYNIILEAQGGRCAICGEIPKGDDRNLDVDHDHKTGRNRGLLCKKCNIGIGYFNDNPKICISAASYLEYYRS